MADDHAAQSKINDPWTTVPGSPLLKIGIDDANRIFGRCASSSGVIFFAVENEPLFKSATREVRELEKSNPHSVKYRVHQIDRDLSVLPTSL